MILILAILAATRASPLGLSSPPLFSRDILQVSGPSCDDPDGCRSLWDIIRNCLLTVFLCTWVSLHPNIPSPDEKWPRIALRRAGLMLLALIAPEAVISWAMRQRLAAAELAKQHKEEGWTISHGFFAIMGGFMEYEGNQPIRVLLPDELDSYSLTGNGDFPRLSRAEIDDKSKGDAISKCVVILQTAWFVTQCIARGAQGLPVTELELATVAFATLNFVIYVLWWDKPQNVQRGIRVYKKRKTEEPIDDGNAEATVGTWDALRDAVSDIPAVIVRGPVVNGFTDSSWLTRVLLWPLANLANTLVPRDEEDDINLKFEKRVGTFYPTKWAASEGPSIFLVATVTVVFGAIHCIGWSFHFPSMIERTIWRFASLCITCVPILIFPLTALGFTIGNPTSRFDDCCENILLTIILSFYVLSRLALLVLPFLCLISLPPAVFHVVHWVSFIPHM